MIIKKYIAALSFVIVGGVLVTLYNKFFLHFNNCSFIFNWPLCTTPIGSQKIVQAVVVLTVCGLLSYVSWRMCTPPLHVFLNRKEKIWLLGVLLMAVCVIPFTSADMRFYYSIGAATNNPYVDDWALVTTPLYAISGETNGVMYGPLAVHLFDFFYWLSQGNFLLFSFLWKLLMLGALIGVGYMVQYVSKLINVHKHLSAVWLIAQPLLIWEWVVAGHFDGLWICTILLAFVGAIQKRWAMVAGAVTVGVWLKFIPIFLVPVFVLWWWQTVERTKWKKHLQQFMSSLVVVSLLTIVSWVGLWQGFRVFYPLILQSKWAAQSIFASVYYSFQPMMQIMLNEQQSAHWWLTRLVQGALCIIVLYLLWPIGVKAYAIALKKYVATAQEYIQMVVVGLSVYLLVWQKSFFPWYIIWLVPFAAILLAETFNSKLWNFIRWLSVTAFLFYIPGLLLPGNDTRLWYYYYVVVLIIMYPLYQLWQWRKISYALQ